MSDDINKPAPDPQNDGSQNPSPDGSTGTQTRQYTADEFKELISQRDKVKNEKAQLQAELEKFRKAEEDKAKKELEAKGEYETLIKQREEEYNQIKSKFDEQNEFLEAVRIDLLSKLSDEHKALAEKLPLKDLQVYVKLNSADNKAGTDNGKPGGTTQIDITGKSWDDLTFKQQEDLLSSNFTAYAKLYKDKYKMNPPVK